MRYATHGNLIDVDALKKQILDASPRERPLDADKCVEMIISLINNAPIIIPAGEPVPLDAKSAMKIFEKK